MNKMSSGIYKLKEQNDMLKKEKYVLSRENSSLRKSKAKLGQELLEEKQIRSKEMQVIFNMLESLQEKNQAFENEIIGIKTKMLVNEEKHTHIHLSVTKLLFKESKGILDKRLFDLDSGSRVEYLAKQLQCTFIEAEKIWNLFMEWRT